MNKESFTLLEKDRDIVEDDIPSKRNVNDKK